MHSNLPKTMKAVQTSKTNSFDDWRIKSTNKYGFFLWPQLNYVYPTGDLVSVLFEIQDKKNTANRAIITTSNRIKVAGIKSYVLDFISTTSPNYCDFANLASTMNLILKNALEPKASIRTYWDYRLATKPSNCATGDIDALEVGKTCYIGIEAAQLYDTSNIEHAIPHIFRTFNRRKNSVNPNQYKAQYNFSNLIRGRAFILFHVIDKSDALCEKSPVFLLNNNANFYQMLTYIKNAQLTDEDGFIQQYSQYLSDNLVQYQTIHEAYAYIKSL